MVIFTIACRNYCSAVLQFAESVTKVYGNDVRTALCVVEPRDAIPPILKDKFDHVLSVEDLGILELQTFLFRHTEIEASTAIKPAVFLRLMEIFSDEENFLFLDPDTWLFSRFIEVEDAFRFHHVLLTPHLLRDEASPDVIGNSIFGMLNAGIFNLGFVGVRHSVHGIDFLMWWKERLERWCYIDQARNLFVDQKWVDFALAFTPVFPIQDPGYNVAHWNLLSRFIKCSDDDFLIGDRPVRFLHMSGLKDKASVAHHLRNVPGNNMIHELAARYVDEVYRRSTAQTHDLAWFYSRFNSGESIRREARAAYRLEPEVQKRISEPFARSNQEILGILDDVQTKRIVDSTRWWIQSRRSSRDDD